MFNTNVALVRRVIQVQNKANRSFSSFDNSSSILYQKLKIFNICFKSIIKLYFDTFFNKFFLKKFFFNKFFSNYLYAIKLFFINIFPIKIFANKLFIAK